MPWVGGGGPHAHTTTQPNHHQPPQPTHYPTHTITQKKQLVFRNPITATGAVGSAVGILGVLLYSLVKQYNDGQQQA